VSTAEWFNASGVYVCAFCGQAIELGGFDPCQVTVESHRENPDDPEAWWFWAHALCVRDRFNPDCARDIPREIYVPPEPG
jgi:hypothetical protein